MTFRAPVFFVAFFAAATILSAPVLASADVASTLPSADRSEAGDASLSKPFSPFGSDQNQQVLAESTESDTSILLFAQAIHAPTLDAAMAGDISIESSEQTDAEPVPEPSSLGLLALGGLLAAMAGARYRLG